MVIHDYKFRAKSSGAPKRRAIALALSLLPALILSATAIFAALDQNADATREQASQRTGLPAPFADNGANDGQADPAEAQNTSPAEPLEPELQWHSHTIRKGDSLSKVFDEFGLGQVLLQKLVASSDTAAKLTRIKPGKEIKVGLDETGAFKRLLYVINKVKSIEIAHNGDEFEATVHERPVEHRSTEVTGIIENSLFLAAQKAGLSDALTMELAAIFGWDIDFALEIRPGDRFSVIYREDWLEGEKLRNGPILAAEFVNQGKTFRALRYENESGDAHYFTPEGKSMRKAFLRTPVKFARISSGFTQKRWHPVLKKWRSHKGVDYAAPRGTPVKASGDGKVIFRGTKGGYGKTIIVSHGQQYTTLYGHLNGFSKKAKEGTRIKQGEVLGYVGSTGLASGPHLHYEFRVNGAHRNPLKVKLPAAAPIKKELLADFKTKTAPLVSQLDSLTETMVAQLQ